MADTPLEMTPGLPMPDLAFFEPRGDTGLKGYGGIIAEEFLRKLQGTTARRVYREMSENDATIRAILEAIGALICGLEWTVTAASDKPEAEEAKRFIEGVFFEDMETPFTDVLSEACTMFAYGFAPMETTYKHRNGWANPKKALRSKFDDGKVGIRRISLLGQTSIQRWQFDAETGELEGLWQLPTMKPGSPCFIHVDKIALFRTSAVKQNPEGRSILRSVYRAWYFKTKIEEIEAVGVERDLAGLPVAFVPSKYLDVNASAEDKAIGNAYKQLVTNVRRDQQEGVVMPSDQFRDGQGNLTGQKMFSFELLSSGGSRAFDTSRIIDRWDRRIATAVLADFLFLGQQAVGSFALSSDKTALFAQAIGAYTKRMAQTLDQVIDELWELNAFEQETKPRMSPGDLEKPELDKLALFLQAMTAAGAQLFPHRETENFLRKTAGLPLLSDDDMGALPPQGVPGEPVPPLPPPKPEREAKPVKKAIFEHYLDDDWVTETEHDAPMRANGRR